MEHRAHYAARVIKGVACCLIGILGASLGACGAYTATSTGSTPCAPLPGAAAASTPVGVSGADLAIYVGAGLSPGYTFGADTQSGRLNKWFTDNHGSVTLCYPSGQQSGVVYITGVSSDIHKFRSFHVEMRGAQGNECVRVGIKDASQGANAETAVQQCLSAAWQQYTFPLSAFVGVKLAQVNIPFEVIFNQTTASTVEFRNLWYSTA